VSVKNNIEKRVLLAVLIIKNTCMNFMNQSTRSKKMNWIGRIMFQSPFIIHLT